MAFPAGPYTDGQAHAEAGTAYTYSAARGAWLKAAPTGAGALPTTTLTGVNSISGGGALAGDLTFQLVADDPALAADMFYGGSATAPNRAFQSTSGLSLNSPATTVPKTYALGTTGSLVGGGDMSVDRFWHLSGDVNVPPADHVYGTDAAGIRGWVAAPIAPAGSASTTRSWNSVAPIIAITGGGNLNANRNVMLANDTATPRAWYYYGTNATSSTARGWRPMHWAWPVGRVVNTTSTQYNTNNAIISDANAIRCEQGLTYLIKLVFHATLNNKRVYVAGRSASEVMMTINSNAYGLGIGSIIYTHVNVDSWVRMFAFEQITIDYYDLSVYRLD